MINAALDSGAAAAGDAGNYLFPNWVTRCLVSNADLTAGKHVFYRVHPVPGSNEASATVYDGIILGGETVEISLDGARSILGVSIWFLAASTPAVRIQGMPV